MELFANLPVTTVVSGGTDAPASGTGQTWTAASSSGWPAVTTGAGTTFHIADPANASELIAVTNISGTTWTVTRGAESTTPVAHTAGFTIKQVVSAGVLGAFLQSSLDTTGTDIQPEGVQAAGATGLAADAGHVHPAHASQSLYLAPAGALAETFPRQMVTGVTSPLTSQTVYVSAIALAKGQTVGTITLVTGTTTESGGSHGWYALLDSGRVVRAVSADQTGATFWGSAAAEAPVAMVTPYTPPSGAQYYLAVGISASGMPSFFAQNDQASSAGWIAIAPVLSATSSTGLTTPPSVGSTLAALTATATPFYGFVS